MSTLPATPTTVLAAIDFSEASDLVVEHALAMARQSNAQEIHFLHVHPIPWDEAGAEGRQAEFEEWLDARVRDSGSVPYTIKVVAHEASGNPADVIVEMAGDLLASAVIVGTHGRKGFQRMAWGPWQNPSFATRATPCSSRGRRCTTNRHRASSRLARAAWSAAYTRAASSCGASSTAKSMAAGTHTTTHASTRGSATGSRFE